MTLRRLASVLLASALGLALSGCPAEENKPLSPSAAAPASSAAPAAGAASAPKSGQGW